MKTEKIISGLIAVSLIFLLGACATEKDDDEPVEEARVYDPTPDLEIGGEREARVILPTNYSVKKRYPLIILLHGYSVNSTIQDVIFGLIPRVDEGDYILVLPEGTPNPQSLQFWNATPECCDTYDQGIDDVGYISGLIEEAIETYAIDEDRVALVGHSNGGYMSYRMICEKPELVRSIVVLAGGVYLDPADCLNPAPVNVLHIHGTIDPTVPYDEHEGDSAALESVGAEEAVRRWRERDGCGENPTAEENRDYMMSIDGDETEVLSWDDCTSGAVVELWRVVGEGHLFVGVNDDFRQAVIDFLIR